MEFSYKAKTQSGEITEGIVEAADENNAVNVLHDKNFVVLSINAIRKNVFSSDLGQIFSRAKTKDIVIFTRQLSTLIDADMPLAEGLRTLAKQSEKAVLRKVIGEISEAVEAGSSLSAALSSYPQLFSSFYIKLVQSGEVSGKLHESLLYLADYLERSQAINSKIKGALTYPAFVVFALVVVAIIMMVYVLPQLLTIFKEVGMTDLPITTRVLIYITDLVNKYIIQTVIVLIVLIFAVWRYLRTESGQTWLDSLKINFPGLGIVVKHLYLARIAESLSTLIKSGIPILDALRITSGLVGNRNYQKIILDAEENVRNGGSISDILVNRKEIPPLLSSMIAIGEKTGKLDFMLEHVSKFYKSESDEAIQNISQLIEPVLILILGFGVALLVSSILLPIYNMVGAG